MASKYDKDYEAYQREVQSYLKKVKGGRRVPAVDPQDPKFSQQADDERQARRSGLGSHIRFGPPSPAFNQVAPSSNGSVKTLPFEELPANHHYDRAAAERHGIQPDPVTQHWDSRFKFDDNSRRFLPSQSGRVFDTKYAQTYPHEQLNSRATSDQVRAYRHEPPIPDADIKTWVDERKRSPDEYPVRGTQRLGKEPIDFGIGRSTSAMATAPSTGQPAPSPGMYDQFVDFLDRTRGALTRQFGSNRGAAPAPVWGFHEPTLNAAEGAGKAAGGAMDVMADPRNAWIGLGPMGVLGKMRGLFKKAAPGPDMGGFNVPTSKMVRDDSGMAAPSHNLWEQEKRDDYMFGRQIENDMVDRLQAGPTSRGEAMERYKQLAPNDQEMVNRTYVGKQELQDEIDNARRPNAGGGQVPPDIRRKFGFR